MFYVNYQAGMELGFSFGSYEDSTKIISIENFCKKIGHFLIKSRNSQDYNESYVSHGMMQKVIEDNSITTIYLNDERPRSGKFSRPTEPNNIMKMLLKSRIEL